jgi:hypothetical protein
VGQGEAGDVVPLRGAVDEEPGARGPPRLSGEALRLGERRGFRAGIDPLRERRDVDRERALPDRLAQPLVGGGAALVPGHVEAAGIA